MTNIELADAMLVGIQTPNMVESNIRYIALHRPSEGLCEVCALGAAWVGACKGDVRKVRELFRKERITDGVTTLAKLLGIPVTLAREIEFRHCGDHSIKDIAAWLKGETNAEMDKWTLSVKGNPVPKPRQTRRDKWQKRPCVLRYRDYADDLRRQAKRYPLTSPRIRKVELLFVIPIPPSYSKKRKAAAAGQPCPVKPDIDNLCKSVLDALWPAGDSAITHVEMRKIWDDGQGARTEIVFRLEDV